MSCNCCKSELEFTRVPYTGSLEEFENGFFFFNYESDVDNGVTDNDSYRAAVLYSGYEILELIEEEFTLYGYPDTKNAEEVKIDLTRCRIFFCGRGLLSCIPLCCVWKIFVH